MTIGVKNRLSLCKGKDRVEPQQRFSEVTNEQLAVLSKGHVPASTEKKNTSWATGVFRHLSLFVTEARKADGKKYPPKTLYQILCGLLRYMRKIVPFYPSFFDQKDGRFR